MKDYYYYNFNEDEDPSFGLPIDNLYYTCIYVFKTSLTKRLRCVFSLLVVQAGVQEPLGLCFVCLVGWLLAFFSA